MCGRNEPCPCGSGKKYKKCCLNKVTNSFEEWKQRAYQISDNKILIETFFAVFNRAMRNNWRRACHTVSSILYVLLREQGIEAQLRIGFVSFKKARATFSHSWITIDGETYDVALYRANPLTPGSYFTEISAPIFKGINLESFTETDIEFGVHTDYETKDKTYQKMTETSVGNYMIGWQGHKMGLWSEVIEIATRLGIHLDYDELKSKYRHIVFQKTVAKAIE